jgi:hypothetical protein
VGNGKRIWFAQGGAKVSASHLSLGESRRSNVGRGDFISVQILAQQTIGCHEVLLKPRHAEERQFDGYRDLSALKAVGKGSNVASQVIVRTGMRSQTRLAGGGHYSLFIGEVINGVLDQFRQQSFENFLSLARQHCLVEAIYKAKKGLMLPVNLGPIDGVARLPVQFHHWSW